MSLESIRGYDAWKTRTPWDDEPQHRPSCPAHEDADEVFECGGHNEHLCSVIEREINGCEIVEAECGCPTPAEIAAERAEYMRDLREDR